MVTFFVMHAMHLNVFAVGVEHYYGKCNNKKYSEIQLPLCKHCFNFCKNTQIAVNRIRTFALS